MYVRVLSLNIHDLLVGLTEILAQLYYLRRPRQLLFERFSRSQGLQVIDALLVAELAHRDSDQKVVSLAEFLELLQSEVADYIRVNLLLALRILLVVSVLLQLFDCIVKLRKHLDINTYCITDKKMVSHH